MEVRCEIDKPGGVLVMVSATMTLAEWKEVAASLEKVGEGWSSTPRKFRDEILSAIRDGEKVVVRRGEEECG